MTPEQIQAAAERRAKYQASNGNMRSVPEYMSGESNLQRDNATLADAYLALRPAFNEALSIIERFHNSPESLTWPAVLEFLAKWKGGAK